MAGGWIKIEHSTPDKPEVMRIARTLGVSENEILGGLVRFWLWCDYQSRDGHALGVTQTGLDRISGVTGMYGAMLDAGWLVEDESGVHAPNYEYHLAENAKARALAAKRKAKQRSADVTPASRSQRDNSVTRVEKSREEKKEEHTHAAGDSWQASVTIPLGWSPELTLAAMAKWRTFRAVEDGRPPQAMQLEEMGRDAASSGWDDIRFSKSIDLAIARGAVHPIDPENNYANKQRNGQAAKQKTTEPETYWKPVPPIVDSPCRIAANKAWAAAKAAGKTDDEAFIEMTAAKNAVLAAERVS